MKTKNIMPPTWLLMAILVMLLLHFLVPGAWVVPQLWNLTGLIFLAAGVMMNLVADSAFHQAHTTVKPFEESTALITNGVFRISRNPMYLGFVLILVGIAIVLRSISPWLVVAVFTVLMDRIYITVEEQAMCAGFGWAYAEYCRHVRRWL
jgi:protein-S-isoprenylcysteine O-methyltransferase Ste14